MAWEPFGSSGIGVGPDGPTYRGTPVVREEPATSGERKAQMQSAPQPDAEPKSTAKDSGPYIPTRGPVTELLVMLRDWIRSRV
ncbi:MAG: hypothetical protein AAFY60_06550 [Myxococcota bacterium]